MAQQRDIKPGEGCMVLVVSWLLGVGVGLCVWHFTDLKLACGAAIAFGIVAFFALSYAVLLDVAEKN